MGFLKTSAILAMSIGFLQINKANASTAREVVKTKAVSVTYGSPSSAYKYAHKACQKYWRKDIANIISERPSFSVEIVAVNISPKTVSALCISRKYINDQVRRVARR